MKLGVSFDPSRPSSNDAVHNSTFTLAVCCLAKSWHSANQLLLGYGSSLVSAQSLSVLTNEARLLPGDAPVRLQKGAC